MKSRVGKLLDPIFVSVFWRDRKTGCGGFPLKVCGYFWSSETFITTDLTLKILDSTNFLDYFVSSKNEAVSFMDSEIMQLLLKELDYRSLDGNEEDVELVLRVISGRERVLMEVKYNYQ